MKGEILHALLQMLLFTFHNYMNQQVGQILFHKEGMRKTWKNNM